MADHWLAQTAEYAGWESDTTPALSSGMDPLVAWSATAAAYEIDEADIARQIASDYRLDLADLDAADPLAVQLLPEQLARRYHVYPLYESSGRLTIAVSNPTDLEAEQALEFASGKKLEPRIATPRAIQQAIENGYSPDGMVEALLERVEVGGDVTDAVRVLDEFDIEEADAEKALSTPVVKLTSMILRDAVQQRASDVHMEPDGGEAIVRFRIDGVLRQYMSMPLPVLNRIVSRIKILGKLDIADRLRPQDGRARIQIDNQVYDLRISTVPTREMEKAVLRILRPDSWARRLDELGLPPAALERMRYLLTGRDGILLVTGPTGSGKTTTLYAALGELATEAVNIMTVEDPIEYELDGITQIQVERRRGLTFATALRAILRQDPDSILVGEIRDSETAEMAVQASLTGHLVLATVHANSAVAVVNRLADLGLDRPSIATTLRGALAQRLVRLACEHCAEPIGDDEELRPEEALLAERYGVRPRVRAVGCELCAETGYLGRTPVVELLAVTEEMQEMIARDDSPVALQRTAIADGMRTIYNSALDRVRAGDTTLQEFERVLGERPEEYAPADDGDARPTEPDGAVAEAVRTGGPSDGLSPEAARLPAQALEHTAHAAAITDREGIVRWVNPAFARLTGYDAEHAVGRELRALESSTEGHVLDRERRETVLGGSTWHAEMENRAEDGSSYNVEAVASPIRDDTGRVQHMIVLHQDITERKRWERRVRHLAMHDPMTDLPNRYALEENLHRATKRAERGQVSALLLIDVDEFKHINETMGRPAGDLCISELAELLRDTLRPGDLLARLGSDDFVALLEDTQPEGALAAAGRLRRVIEESDFTYGERSFDPTISVGVAPIVSGLDDNTVMVHAGSALRRAKDRGGNQTALYEEERAG